MNFRKTAPAPPTIRTIREVLSNVQNPIPLLMKMSEEYGPIVRWQAGQKLVAHFLTHPDYVRHVLQDNHQNYEKFSVYHNSVLKDVLGNGLVSNNGEAWLRQRRMIQPIFRRSQLGNFIPPMVDAANDMLAHWQYASEQNISLDISQEMLDLGRYINGQVIMQADVKEEIDEGQAALRDVLLLALIFGTRFPSRRHRRFRRAAAMLDKAVWEIIQAHHDAPTPPEDILTMLIQAKDKMTGQGMSPQQLRDELVTFIFAGYETTEKVMSWIWYLLATNPEVEQKLHQEIDHVLAGRTPTSADLPALEYTGWVIEETMRLYPPAWILGRKAIADDEIGGYHIPAGSGILLSQYITQHHPDYWEAPEAFVPERFSPVRVRKQHRYACFPFGGGPRQCVGKDFALMQMKLLVAMVAQKFTLRVVPGHKVEFSAALTLEPKGGLPMMVHPRK